VVEINGNLSASVATLSSSTGQFSITACLNYKGHNVPDTLGWFDPFLNYSLISSLMELVHDYSFYSKQLFFFLLRNLDETEC